MSHNEDYLEDYRDNISYKGPLGFPDSWKDPAYRYYWGLYDPKRHFTFQELLDKGYDYVTKDMLPGDLSEKLPEHRLVGENRIGVVCDKLEGRIQYLMRIPMDRYLKLKKIRDNRVNSGLKAKTHLKGEFLEAELRQENQNVPIKQNN